MSFCENLECVRLLMCDGLFYHNGEYLCRTRPPLSFWSCIYVTRDRKIDFLKDFKSETMRDRFYREPIKVIANFEKFKRQNGNK